MLQLLIARLTFQLEAIPLGSYPESAPTLVIRDGRVAGKGIPVLTVDRLVQILFLLLPHFQRTYLIVDRLNEISFPEGGSDEDDVVDIIKLLLEQDFGNISIATFSRPKASLTALIKLADVSIRLLKINPQAENVRQYIRSKIERTILPELNVPTLSNVGGLDEIERAIFIASDGL